MFHLMIADDNPHILQELSEITDWESFGFELVGTFSNGKDLLDAAKKDLPDLVITDISMPIMDGLQLATELNNLKANIKIIFISSYSEFDYARTALKLGIFDYILKPVRLNQLLDITGRVLDQLRQEQLLHFEQQKTHSQQEYYRKTALSHYVSTLLFYADDEAHIREELSQLGLTVAPATNLVLTCFALEAPLDTHNKLQTYNYLQSILSYDLKETQIIPMLTGNQQSAFLLLYRDQELSVSDLLAKVCLDVEAKTNLHITMGYSSPSENFTDLPVLYRQAQEVLEYLTQAETTTPIASYSDLFMAPTVDELQDTSLTMEYSEIVAIMRTYIEENYMNPLTTNDVAQHVFLSPTYANHCFTSECGTTIFGYITQYRMDKAMVLLTESEESIARIAELVGYSSKTSFYLAFKRYTGLAPTAYRIKHT
ncbi:MAG: response regulator [Oscillospiraceae bacterium]|nr:response regulator [Oscillospiraceae bacterium]